MNRGGLNKSMQLILKFILIFCLLFPLILWGQYWGNENHSPNIFYELIQFSFIVIIAILGAVYVLRGFRLGVFLLTVVQCLTLVKTFLYQSKVDYVYWILFLLSFLFFLIFIIRIIAVKEGWKKMKNGADLKHFRHIYQLTFIFVFILLSSTAYVFFMERGSLEDAGAKREHSVSKESIHDLDDIAITLNDISYIEQHTPNLSFEQESRIMALRHLLAGHIVSSKHDFKAFRAAYQMRKEALSEEQKEVLDWFFRQHSDAHNLWERTTNVSSIADLKREMKKMMHDRGIKEY